MRIKVCPECGNQFFPPRRDMRFCNVWCRVKYNNAIAKEERRITKHCNLAIMRNYRLLKSLLTGRQSLTIPFATLKQKGFDVSRMTSIRRVEDKTLFCVYDIGYRKEDNNQIIITKTN